MTVTTSNGISDVRKMRRCDSDVAAGDLREGVSGGRLRHSKGVTRRDLKPSNVMVGKFGEVQVMDWGLAKVLSRDDDAIRLQRVLASDAGMGRLRHVDAGYEKAIHCAEERGVTVPGLNY